MKKLSKILEILKLKWLRETSLTILLIAIIIALFIGINVGVELLDIPDIDLTEEKLYTLTDESKEAISKIPEKEEMEIYILGIEEKSSVVDLIKQYKKVKENIKIEIANPNNRLDLVSKYGVDKDSSSVLIVSGEKYKLLGTYDFYTYDYNTGNSVDITEQRITNGMIAVSSIGKSTPIYILTGHGEYTINSQLVSLNTYLELENYELKELDLLVNEKVPEDCSALIVSSPTKDFTELETNKIKEYINNGGDILWMNNTMATTEELPNIKSILDIYGVTMHQDGIMVEQDPSKIVMQAQDLILPKIESTSLTGELASEGTVMFIDSGKLTFVEEAKFGELGVVKTELLTTSDKSFYRTDLSITSLVPIEGEEVGKQVVGAVLEKSLPGDSTSKLVIYANSLFAADYPMRVGEQTISAVYLYNNLDLVLNTIEYISEKEDLITIRKGVENTYYTATETQNTIIKVIIFGVPILIIIVGIIVWQLRRRKK